MGKMRKTSKELCEKCKYHYGGDNALICCDYFIRTGNRRNCVVGKCDKFEKGKWQEKCET